MCQESLRVSKFVENNLIYEEVPGTDEFNFEEEDDMNSNREIYLSDQGSLDLNFHLFSTNHYSIRYR